MGMLVSPQGGLPFLGSYTWATRPAAATNAGATFWCTDLGGGGILLVSNGTVWRSLSNSPIEFFGLGISIILPASGSIANNGALTLGTALTTTYSVANTGGCYMYFATDTIAVGVPAGLYYVVMSSTTVGTIYNNTYTSNVPIAPVSPTPFVTTGPGAYTQTTSEVTLITPTIPGGLMGKNGRLTSSGLMVAPANTNSKTVKLKSGAIAIRTYAAANSGSNSFDLFESFGLRNRNSESIQISGVTSISGYVQGIGGSAFTGLNINTASNFTLSLTGQLAVATDYIEIPGFTLQVRPA
jgi:hypothetical protein